MYSACIMSAVKSQIPHNKIFNIKANICQRKSTFHTQMLIWLKSSLIRAHLRSDAMAIQQLAIYMRLYVENLSIIYQYISTLINFSKLYYYSLLI